MSRDDYIALAAVIARQSSHLFAATPGAAAIEGIVADLADRLKRDDPEFDREQFFIASGLTSHGKVRT